MSELMCASKKDKKVIVVGGGLAGLAATMKLAENGCKVQLISVTKVKRSHSVCAQGGINAAMNAKNEDDSPIIHAYDTIKGGGFPGRPTSHIRDVPLRPVHHLHDGEIWLPLQSY